MPCRECGRLSPFPLCSGCRTLSRISVLWRDLHERDLPSGVGLLRDCAGALTDLAETSFSAPPEERGSGGGEPPESGRGTPKAEAATPKGEVKPEEVTPARKVDKSSEKKLVPVKEELPLSEVDYREDSYSYESFEEVVGEAPDETRKDVSRELPRSSSHCNRGGDRGGQLGLHPLPVKLSHRDPQPSRGRHDGGERRKERKQDRTEEDREHKRRSGADPPRSPSHPPAAPGASKAVRRSRSRRKRTKGKKKRERGEEWRRHNPHWKGGWRRKHY